MLKFLTLIAFIISCSCGDIVAQRSNHRSKSDLGLFGGGMYYIGDLNPETHFEQSELCFGALFRYNVHSRLSIRSSFTYGTLKAADAKARSSIQQNRNLSFESELYEFAAGFEFNYVPYQTGHDRHRVSPYLFAELGLFHFDPKTEYNGNLVALQPLGTEGQGSNLSKRSLYKKTQFTLPIGIGIKMSLTKNISFNLEYVARKTFTDFLDDVSANRYIDRAELASANGPLVAELSNRSLDGNANGMRGNPSTKDWYFSFTAGLNIRLGPPDRCFH